MRLFTLLCCFILAAPVHAETLITHEQVRTKAVAAFADLENEDIAFVIAARKCEHLTAAEMEYWQKIGAFAKAVLLSDRSQNDVLRAAVKSDAGEAKLQSLVRTGCRSPEFINAVREFKVRIRVAGASLLEMEKAHAAAVVDLYREPKN